MEAFLLMAIALLGFSDVGEKGYVEDLMMMAVFECWWQNYSVNDFRYVT